MRDQAEPGGGGVVLAPRRLPLRRLRGGALGRFGRRRGAASASRWRAPARQAWRRRRRAETMNSRNPLSGRRRASAGTCSSASPNTPPKPGRQRPGADARQRGGEGGGQQRDQNPDEAAPFLAERPVRQQPPAEQRFRRQQQHGGEAQELHRQIGEDGAGEAEQIVDRLLRGVAERGVLHRPGGERDGAEQRDHQQRQAGQLAQAPPQDVAEMLRDEGDDVETAIG